MPHDVPQVASLPSSVVIAKSAAAAPAAGARLVLLLTPLYWFLLSVAAWRALFQLLYDPQGWEKTEHGLARTSRLAEAERY